MFRIDIRREGNEWFSNGKKCSEEHAKRQMHAHAWLNARRAGQDLDPKHRFVYMEFVRIENLVRRQGFVIET